MPRLCFITFVLYFFISNSATLSAQHWDVDKIQDLHQWTFRMSQEGDSLGYSKIDIRRIGSQLVVSEDSNVPDFSEDMFAYMDGKTLKVDSVLVVGRLSGYPIECKVRADGNRMKGYLNFPKHPSRPTVGVNETLPEGFIIRLNSFFLSPFYKDLSVGREFSYRQFSSMDGQQRTINAKIVGEEKVTIDGITYDTVRLELSGGVAEQNLFIETSKNRIVKISFRNNNWIYELINP